MTRNKYKETMADINSQQRTIDANYESGSASGFDWMDTCDDLRAKAESAYALYMGAFRSQQGCV